MRAIYELLVDITENGGHFPAVTHAFRGLTQQEAQDRYLAHLQADSFLRECVQGAVANYSPAFYWRRVMVDWTPVGLPWKSPWKHMSWRRQEARSPAPGTK